MSFSACVVLMISKIFRYGRILFPLYVAFRIVSCSGFLDDKESRLEMITNDTAVAENPANGDEYIIDFKKKEVEIYQKTTQEKEDGLKMILGGKDGNY